MDQVLNWGLELVRSAQSLASPALTAAMQAITLLGSIWFYLIALPVVFWCLDERLGLRMALVSLFSTFVNLSVKNALAQPRPYELDPAVGLSSESTYGFPSNHAQGTAVFWALLAPAFRKPWGLLTALAVTLAVGFTRVYLGVHFPTDLFGGWALAALILLAWALLGRRLEAFLSAAHLRVKVILAAAVALVMNALGMDDTSISGMFFGVAVGAAFMFEKLRFDASEGGFPRKALRLAVGAAGIAILYLLGAVLSRLAGEQLHELTRFVRYGILGLWMTLGAPWLFLKTGLGKARPAGD